MSYDQEPSIIAQDYFEAGFACAPSVLMAFAEQFALPVESASRLAAAFGGGISRTGNLCGAVSGALMVVGLQAGGIVPGDKEARERTYAMGQRVIREFADLHGAVFCPALLDGCLIGTPEGQQRAREEGLFESRCPVFVHDAAEIAERILKE